MNLLLNEIKAFRYRFAKFKSIHQLISIFKRSVFYFVIKPIRKQILHRTIKYLRGPEKIENVGDGLIVVCLVKNGEFHIKTFIEHYLALGVKHIVFLDNNSSDRTISIAEQYPNITIWQSNLPYKHYQLVMKNYLMTRFGKGGWCLCVDVDELFDYPMSDRLSLSDFLAYLNYKAYTAVVAHTLDMFPEKLPIENHLDNSFKETHTYYDLSNITKVDYYFLQNIIPTPPPQVYNGGIRQTIFGNSSTFVLTKHPLVFLDGKTKPMFTNPHDVRYASIADISCVLLHYKFLGDFYQKTRQAVDEENYAKKSDAYKKYLKVLQENPQIKFKQKTAQQLQSINELIDNQFLAISNDYLQWVRTHCRL